MFEDSGQDFPAFFNLQSSNHMFLKSITVLKNTCARPVGEKQTKP